MSAPKLSVETPWAAEFHRQFRPGRFWRNVGPHERNRAGCNVLENIPGRAAANQRFAEHEMQCLRPEVIRGGHLFDLRFVHLRQLIEKGLGLRLMSTERVERHSPVGLLTRL